MTAKDLRGGAAALLALASACACADGGVHFRESGPEGRVAVLSNSFGVAEVALRGARVMSFRQWSQPEPVLSEPGGLFCDAAQSAGFAVAGVRESDDESALLLAYRDGGRRLDAEFSLSDRLKVEFSVRNAGTAPMPGRLGLHPHFRVSDASRVSVPGLRCPGRHPVLAADYVLRDLGLGREIVVGGLTSPQLVLRDGLAMPPEKSADLSGGEERRFFCLEPAEGDAAADIEPGGSRQASMTVMARPCREWAPPTEWAPRTIAGRDFHMFGRSLGPGRWEPPATNSLLDMSCEYRILPGRAKDGRWSYSVDGLSLLRRQDGAVRPFTLNLFPRIPCRPNVFLVGEMANDEAAYRAFKAAHPEFVGFVDLEWVNDALQPLFGGGNLVNNRVPKYRITQAELAEVLARDDYVHAYDDRAQFTTNLLKKSFGRICELCFNDPSKLWIGEGSFCADHLCADWGAGGLAIETTRNYCFWQIQMSFCRGAARQYDLPWYWYVASFFLGYGSDGKWSSKGNQNAWTPEQGISRSAVRRASYMTWLSGATCYQREGMEHAFYRPDTHELAEEGAIYDEFWRFAHGRPRGVPYQPVALVVPFMRGYTRQGGLAYKRFAYTHADHMLDVVMSALLDYPRNNRRDAARRGVERVMANSRHGDVFDVLVPDAGRRGFFRTAVMRYPCAVLVGEYGDDAEMEGALKEYVEAGGTLVLNAAQVTDGLRWALGGAVVKTDGAGRPVYSRRPVGRGAVILSHERFWSPWYGDENASRALGEVSLGDPVRYADVEWLFDRLLPRYRPADVDGDVQYGFNRVGNGWHVYLVNNGGVTKFADRQESFDPYGARVTIDVSRIPHTSAVELRSGRRIAERGGVLSVTVPSGDVMVIAVVQ